MTSSKQRFKLIPAVYLVLRDGNHVLLSRRANTDYQDGTYSLVAGHLDGDETAKAALAREVKEEASINIDPSQLKLVHTAHRLSRGQIGQERVDFFFEIDKWSGEINNNEPEKCDDLSWHDIDKLPESIMPYIRLVLAAIVTGKPYSEYETEPVS